MVQKKTKEIPQPKTNPRRQTCTRCGASLELPQRHRAQPVTNLDSNLHSPDRRLIELRMEHADLDALIDRIGNEQPLDELMMRRLKKRRLGLRDEMARLQRELDPNEPA